MRIGQAIDFALFLDASVGHAAVSEVHGNVSRHYPAHHCLFVFLGRSVLFARSNIESWKLSLFSSSFSAQIRATTKNFAHLLRFWQSFSKRGSLRLGNFLGTKYRCLRAVAEGERAAVTGRQSQQFSFGLSDSELLSPPHDLAQLLNLDALLVNAQFGIAHDVDEKNMGDLPPEFRFLFVRHRGMNPDGSGKALYINFLRKNE
jgi:hypothetical protein